MVGARVRVCRFWAVHGGGGGGGGYVWLAGMFPKED